MIIPPKAAPQPMRITCRYIRENALLHPPNLNEGEGMEKLGAEKTKQLSRGGMFWVLFMKLFFQFFTGRV